MNIPQKMGFVTLTFCCFVFKTMRYEIVMQYYIETFYPTGCTHIAYSSV